MCNAMTLRKHRDEIRAFARELSLILAEPMPAWESRYRIGPRQYGLIIRPAGDGEARLEPAIFDLIPPGQPSKYLLTNARSDKLLTGWPWKAIHRSGRCLTIADGFYEPEKVARSKEKAPWSWYSRPDDQMFAMAGLFTEAAHPETGEVISSFAVITTDASADMYIHDRMPVILGPDDARAWLTAEETPIDLLQPAPAGTLRRWRVGDAAKSSRAPDGPALIESVETGSLL